jgi:hypothetical protein
MVLSYEALADNVSSEDVVEQVIRKIPMPQIGQPGETENLYQEEHILRANTRPQPAPRRRRWSLWGGKPAKSKPTSA